MIKVEKISSSYGTRRILKDISFEVPPGSILGIVGPNGSGKTTLIRVLSGVLPVQSGRIFVKGRDLLQMSSAQRARQIAVVPQAVNLPPAFTTLETVLLGRTPHLNWLGQASEHDLRIVQDAMQRTSILELSNRYVGELSGGEQQRILLARALAQGSPVLLMDEPTSHLDLHHQLSLLEQIRTLARDDGYTILMVLHDLNLVARFADRVALLVDGILQPPGLPSEVFTPEALSEVYQVPLKTVLIGQGRHPVILPAGF